MTIYKYDRFLAPITENSKIIKILHEGEVTITIIPKAVLNVLVDKNTMKINMKSKRIIILQFSTINEAGIALELFKKQLDIIRGNKIPSFEVIEVSDIVTVNNRQYECWYREDMTGNNFRGGVYDGDNIYIHLKEIGTGSEIVMPMNNILDMKSWNSLIWQELHPGSNYGRN